LDDPRLIQGLHGAIPREVVFDYIEAAMGLRYKLFKSCAVMCRRTVQRALLIKEVPDGRPKEMIQKAEEKGILTRKLGKLGETVVFFGNSGAHPQDTEINDVGELEATQGLLVTKEIILHLFPAPKPPPGNPVR